MQYSELKEIINHLKKKFPCSTCKKKFLNQDLQVLSTFQNEGILHFNCHNCKNQMLIHVAIVSQNQEKSTFSIETKNAVQVSPNEILDIHNFLNNFNGDFKELFSQQSE